MLDEMAIEKVAGYRQGMVTGHILTLPREFLKVEQNDNHCVYRVSGEKIRLSGDELPEHDTVYVLVSDRTAVIGTGWEPGRW